MYVEVFTAHFESLSRHKFSFVLVSLLNLTSQSHTQTHAGSCKECFYTKQGVYYLYLLKIPFRYIFIHNTPKTKLQPCFLLLSSHMHKGSRRALNTFSSFASSVPIYKPCTQLHFKPIRKAKISRKGQFTASTHLTPPQPTSPM